MVCTVCTVDGIVDPMECQLPVWMDGMVDPMAEWKPPECQ